LIAQQEQELQLVPVLESVPAQELQLAQESQLALQLVQVLE
jgi:hypothetical protein